MRTGSQFALLLALLAPLARGGEIVDRVILHVNHRVILQSELDETLRYEALLTQSDPTGFTEGKRQQAMCDLVDRLLIDEEIDRRTFLHASQEDVARQMAYLRRQLPDTQTDDGWRARLDRYGLSEADVESLVAEQLDILRYEDARFRPTIQIDNRSIETYYLEQFIPQLHKAGAREVPLKEVSSKIEEILVQQRISESVDAWLSRMRDEAHGDEEQLQRCQKGKPQ